MSQIKDCLPHRKFGRLPTPTLRQLWIGLPFFILLLKGFLFPLPLLDFWWHLKMGQVILDRGSIPRFDIFSFTATGKVFIIQNWLGEILFDLIYKAGGFPLLVFVNATLLACMLIPIFYLCRRVSSQFWGSIFSTCVVALCMPCNMRPQVFSYVLFAVFYELLESYRSGHRNWIWAMPFLMILWVNLHGAFVLGVALIAVILCCEGMRSFWNASQPDALNSRQLVRLIIVCILCALATLANPEKLGVYSYIHTVMNDPSSRQFVVEWQPPIINSIQGIVQFYFPFFLTTLVLISSERRPSLTEMALYAGFSAFGLTATRNAVWFLIVAAPILARHLPSAKWASAFSRHGTRMQSDSTSCRNHAQGRGENRSLNFAIASLAFIVLNVQSPWVQQSLHHGSLIDSKTPVGAMDYIERESLNGNIFHPQEYGDYLIWRLWPRQRSFFDGRVHLFGESLVRAYQQIYRDSHGEELLRDYNIRFLLLSKTEEKPEDKKMIDRVRSSGNWALLYEDEISVLFEKASRSGS
jgi:hypothetical protein